MLSIVFLTMMLGGAIFILETEFISTPRVFPEGTYTGLRLLLETYPASILFSLYTLVILTVYFVGRFEFFGTVEIVENGFIFRAPLCKKRVFLYEDLMEFGIDYGWLSVSRQFWIYFAKKPIDPKYRNRINRLKFTKDYMRFQYSKEMYERVYAAAPKEFKKKWERQQALLRRLKEE